MLIKKGIAASLGIAMGPALVIKKEQGRAEKRMLTPEEAHAEVHRFKNAVEQTRADLKAMRDKVLSVLGKKHARLIDAHNLILSDVIITQTIPKKIRGKLINAEYALQEALDNIERQFAKIDDEYFRERRFDFIDVFKKIASHLASAEKASSENISEPSVLVASSLFPSDTMAFRENKNVLGFCTDLGSKASHTAIFAQSAGLPAVVGLVDISSQLRTGDYIIADGEQGIVIVNPSAAIINKYKARKAELEKEEALFSRLKDLPAVTVDGHKVNVFLNLDAEGSPFKWKRLKAGGIGLCRTEGLFMNRSILPSEDEQYEKYLELAKAYSGCPVIIRTADIGGDRATKLGIKGLHDERNPFMGFRGIRLFLKYPELLKTQLRALFRANIKGNISIMIPMVTSYNEVEAFRQIADSAIAELAAEGRPAKPCRLGIMIEIPSAALIVDQLLSLVDFISVGTNDLIQYSLAVDRVNQYVSSLYEPFHPAVLRLLHLITEAAKRCGKEVSICGEMASDPEAAAFLVGIGVDTLSVTPKMFLRIKNAVRKLNFKTSAAMALSALDLPSAKKVRALFDRENSTHSKL